ncbi:MAG: hypothetical protein ACO1SX_23540 [Actinomycetota bacterium]
MSCGTTAESGLLTAIPPDPALVSSLERFARDEVGPADLLPWADGLAPETLARLRSDLSLVLSEPAVTGEALDWREVQDILGEYAGELGWDGELITAPAAAAREAPYAVVVRPVDLQTLASASAAVQSAAREVLRRFLPFHPTSAARLARGHLKKLTNRDVWQIQLPDGYRLRFLVAQPERTVHVVYLGPHPDGDADGREQAIRAEIQRRRHGG